MPLVTWPDIWKAIGKDPGTSGEDYHPALPAHDPVVDRLSHAVGVIERGINEAKFIVEQLPLENKEEWFEQLDQICDHAYEVWRHMMYGEPQARWRRMGEVSRFKDYSDHGHDAMETFEMYRRIAEAKLTVPEQEKLAQDYAKKIAQAAKNGTKEDVIELCRQLIVDSEMAEGEDASEVGG